MSDQNENNTYQTVTERYYTPYYSLDVQGKPREDHCILFHHNRLCVITIAPTHPLLTAGHSVVKVDFQITKSTNRLTNKVSGKGKRGGQWVTKTSPLCKVHCADGTEYTLYSCINGKLVEVNDNLIDDPNLLISKHQSEGYVAIVLPKYGMSEPQKEGLCSQEQYKEQIKEKNSTSLEN